jgi:hypothetical protein
MTAPLTLRVRTNAGDTTINVPLSMEQVDDNFIALKTGVSTVEQSVTVLTQQVADSDSISMAIALG